VGVAAALGVAPRRDRLGWFSQRWANGGFDQGDGAAVLEAWLQEWPGRIVVVWEGGGRPQENPIPERVVNFAGRLTRERFPPHAPMRHPIEFRWRWLKESRWTNVAPRDAFHLDQRVVAELTTLQDDQDTEF
jgi:hypothetical protein